MDQQTLTNWSPISQIVATIILFIGTVISMWLSVKALREIQTDRKLRQQPHLLFDSMGMRMSIEFVKAGKAIPGINPKSAMKAFSNMPDDAESVRLKHKKNADGSVDIPSISRTHSIPPSIMESIVGGIAWLLNVMRKRLAGNAALASDVRKQKRL